MNLWSRASISAALVGLPPFYSAAALLLVAIAQAWGGLQPCSLCLYQRVPHGAAVVFGVLGIFFFWRSRIALARLLMVLAAFSLLATAGIAAFHLGVEWHWWHDAAQCASTLETAKTVDELRAILLKTPVARCDEIAWSFLGISMAGYNFLFSGLVGVISLLSISWVRSEFLQQRKPRS